MAEYLKSLPANAEAGATPYAPSDVEARQLATLDFSKTGSQTYYEYCSNCHVTDGSGYYPYQPPLAGTPVIMDPDPSSLINITLNGSFFCAREFARRHLAAGTPASIINIGASYAWTGGPGFAHSAAAKAGVKNMVETLAVEWGPYGIQVNGLVPGLFPHDDMTADIKGNLARSTEHEKDRAQPAMRVGRLRELGWAATFLASPYARFISGHTLVVDGANWQRRSLTNPPVVTVREQMGKGPRDF